MASEFCCDPLSRKEIRSLANNIRKRFNIPFDEPFPVVEFLEMLPEIFEKSAVGYEIVENDKLPQNVHAEYDAYTKTIRIKEFVYDGACMGNGRDLMTILHEIAHFLLLSIMGVKFYRVFSKKVQPYNDPEWQAKCLAGELMMPAQEIRGMTSKEISKKYKVSLPAAQYQLSKI
ncbi:MAG: ImmA/IrrE family metallo-endopeptidase [Clostridium sp.]|nr:ImmA/IrrE family metallo-endopeptidase [Clostridium sp.]